MLAKMEGNLAAAQLADGGAGCSMGRGVQHLGLRMDHRQLRALAQLGAEAGLQLCGRARREREIVRSSNAK